MKKWFDVDENGLSKLVDGKSKSFVIHELIQNSWDTEASEVVITLSKIAGSPKAVIKVEDDDPDGFKNFSHAWTVFAESSKKDDPTKRGLFNMGEKLVLALCYSASIKTTKGMVVFDDEGRHNHPRQRTEKGSVFEGLIRMNQEEYEECCDSVRRLIPPAQCKTYFNGLLLESRTPIATIEAALPTTKSDESGIVRPTRRKTEIHVYEPLSGELASIYEKGIPVVETGDKWHIDIQQRVPLNMNRDNVTPSFLREVRTIVANHLYEKIEKKDANSAWVNDALADQNASPSVVSRALDLKYGEKRAIYDMSDKEANMNLLSKGYSLIYGAQLTKDQWDNVKKFNSAEPAGKILPTKVATFSPGGKDCYVPEDKWTPEMKNVVSYSKKIGKLLLGGDVSVSIINDATQFYTACFGSMKLVFNLGKLGKSFFLACESGPTDKLNSLLIHEFGHHFCSNHLDHEYHEALCSLGAKLSGLTAKNPSVLTFE